MRRRSQLIIACIAAGLSSLAQAASAEEFYADRKIDIIIGFSPGGGYDLYARLLAQHMGEHIPGKPRLIPRNMAGAGSRTAAAYVANVAPKDGTVMAIVSQALPLEQALGSKQSYDVTQFAFIGTPVQENNVLVTWAASQVRSIDDAKRREVAVGSTGEDPSSHYPKIANELLGTRFRIVFGYPGGNDINLAMERGELDGRGSSAVTEWKSNRADWVSGKKINLLFQVGLNKDRAFPDVPLLLDLASGDEERAIFKLLSDSVALGRPFFTAPGVPEDRLRALRAAFDATMGDKAFAEAARRQQLDISPISGPQLQRIVEDIAAAPPAVLSRLKAMLGAGR